MRAEPSDSFYIQWAVFNGQAGNPIDPKGSYFRISGQDGVLLISEFAYTRGIFTNSELPGKYAIGIWTYTKTVDHLVSVIQTDPNDSTASVPLQATNNGFYVLLDQGISEKFSAFIRYGVATGDVNQTASNLSLGVVFEGLIPSREKDLFGLGISHVTNSEEYKTSQLNDGTVVENSETAFEMTYRLEPILGVSIQPNFQYIFNPGTDPTLSNAKVFALRFEVSL